MNCLKSSFVLLFLLPLASMAQEDTSVKMVLTHPTKAFKVLGQYWQRNGNNYIFSAGGMTVQNTLTQYRILFPHDAASIEYNQTKSKAIATQNYLHSQAMVQFGFMMSYEQLARKTGSTNREMRLGIFYNSVEDINNVHRLYFTPPAGYATKYTQYLISRGYNGFAFKADYLIHSPVVLKRLAFYYGIGANVSLPLSQNFTMQKMSFVTLPNGDYHQTDTVPPALNIHSVPPALGYGLYAIGGVKVNLSCRANLFIEYRPEILLTSYLNRATFAQTCGSVQIGLRRKLNVYDFPDEVEPNKRTAPIY